MAPVNFLMNLLWLVLGGLWLGIGWYLAGVVMAITIIGIPFATQSVKLAGISLFPFGAKIHVD